jgi:glycosyl transferase, family 25
MWADLPSGKPERKLTEQSARREHRNPFPVFLINLDSSKQRLKVSEAQLHAAGVSFERIIAVDGRNKPVSEFPTYDEAAAVKYYGRGLSSGEIGCYLSHVKALKQFVKSGHQMALVLEDDFLCQPGCWDMMAALEAAISDGKISDWDLINLNQPPKRFYSWLTNIGDNDVSADVLRAFYFPARATAILWSRSGAKSFLAEAQQPICPVDHGFRRRVSENARGLGISPNPFWVTGAASDISEAAPHWKKPRRIGWYRWREVSRQTRCLALASWTKYARSKRDRAMLPQPE